ncbi:MAG: serine/threonine-protein kinase [Kofleriaceae bacterium]
MAQTPRPAADAGISIGQVFLGKYRVDAILGHGGMGVVAECTHLGLNERVAMKMLRQDVLLDRDATERFMREAQSASKLRSEHVARVVDVGTFHDSGVPYMVMEFLDGHDLGDLLEQRGTIPAAWASMLVLQAAEALAEAHSIGIVHRDIKPSNLFVTWRPDGTAILKVLDFGISKAPAGNDMQLTQTQSLLGTPAYMSPEQMRSARLVDARTDIWSLGTVMYELLEGRRPFEAESFSEMCVKVAVDAPEPMTNAPPALQQVVLRCLAKNPEQRYANMAELGRDLVPFVQDGHQATLLVERMQRTLGRRSHIDWDREGGTGARPQQIRDFASAPIAVPRRSPLADSGPAIQPYLPGSRHPSPVAGVPERLSQPHDSAPARAPSETSATVAQPRRSMLPWVFLLSFIVIGVGIGLAVGLSKSSSTEPQQRVVAPVVDTTSPPPPPLPPKELPPTPAVVPEVKRDEIGIVPAGKKDVPPVVGTAKPPSTGASTHKQTVKKEPVIKKEPEVVKPPVNTCPVEDRTPSGQCATKPISH